MVHIQLFQIYVNTTRQRWGSSLHALDQHTLQPQAAVRTGSASQ
jgi:hypothetical protein